MIARREVKIIRDGSRAAHRDIIIRIRATAIHTAYRMMGELRRAKGRIDKYGASHRVILNDIAQ